MLPQRSAPRVLFILLFRFASLSVLLSIIFLTLFNNNRIEIIFPMNEALVLQIFLIASNSFGALLILIFDELSEHHGAQGLIGGLYVGRAKPG